MQYYYRKYHRVLGDIPETTAICEHHEQCTDIIKMYISVCSLMTKCVTTNKKAHHFMIHSHYSINCFFSMINFNLFCKYARSSHRHETLWIKDFNNFLFVYSFKVILRRLYKHWRERCGVKSSNSSQRYLWITSKRILSITPLLLR